jgi:hypothetical protein
MSWYCTQIGPDGSGAMRCGPASCASVLLSEGYQSDPWELTLQLTAECPGSADGTTSQDLLNLMGNYGFTGGRWDTWSDLAGHWERGRAVLLLNANWHLTPRPYPAGEDWNAMHWLRMLGEVIPDKMIYTYDPLTWIYQPDGSAWQGPTVQEASSLKLAGEMTGYSEYGIWLASPTGRNLNRA